MTIDRQLEINEKRRFAADDRYAEKMEKAAEKIGELMRDGKIVYYVCWNTTGGKFKTLEGDYSKVLEKAMKLV